MAATTKAKPKATKGTAKGKPAAKGKAAKSTKSAAKTKAPAKVIDTGTFVKFNGYSGEVDPDEAAFEPEQTLYIVGSEPNEEGDGTLYTAILASDIETYEKEGAESENITGGEVGGGEITPLKGTALAKAEEHYAPVHVMGRLEELLDEHSGDAVEVAVELSEEISQTYFWLGGALAKVLQDGSYLKENGGEYEGEDAFNDFCQEKFGFKASKGRNLARIYKTFSALPDFDPEKLSGIGWSIANKAEKYVTADNVDEVLEVAAGESQRTVDAVLKEKFASPTGQTASGRSASRESKVSTITMSFKLDEDAGETVKLAIQQCMKENGIESEAIALERICTEWAADHVQGKTAKQNIERKARKAAANREKSTEPAAKSKPAASSGRGRKKAA